MLNFLKRKNTDESTVPSSSEETPKPKSFFSRLKEGLAKTRSTLSEGISHLFLGKKELNAEVLELIETHLLSADVGVEATQTLIRSLTQKLQRNELSNSDAALSALKEDMKTILKPREVPLALDNTKKPFTFLVVGINGSGKTTTIGKLAKQFQNEGLSVMLAAGDTFRAAAIEQLNIWGERNQTPVIAQQPGADSAAVIFDALASAKAKNIQVLIADTAGRLHTQSHLMEELKKVKRVLQKIDPEAPHETLLILDASIGQNALIQAKQFNDAIGITGIALTKLDGTAKGGIIFAIAKELAIPIRYIGVGEGIDDLKPFHADEFIEALFESTP